MSRPELDIEIAWERHSEMVEVIECDYRSEMTVMKRKDFFTAIREYEENKRPYSGGDSD